MSHLESLEAMQKAIVELEAKNKKLLEDGTKIGAELAYAHKSIGQLESAQASAVDELLRILTIINRPGADGKPTERNQMVRAIATQLEKLVALLNR